MAEPVLREGSSGDAVRQLQEALKELGHDPGAVDGRFGAHTEAAVRAYQQERGIAVDGVVGQITWRNIDEAAEFDKPTLRKGSTGLAVRRGQDPPTLGGRRAGRGRGGLRPAPRGRGAGPPAGPRVGGGGAVRPPPPP